MTLGLREILLLVAILLYALAAVSWAPEGLNLHAVAGAVFAAAFLA